ncbi:MAG: ABC transporter ATP-binding protein, partial [Bacteroidales bacterium]|nr:ABC transporter ATP-binding protein [Bacteroidales bacterium]
MRQFWKVLKRYVRPYRGYLAGSVALNMFSAIFNVFSFSLVIPMLQILFKINEAVYTFIPWGAEGYSFKEKVLNNAYYEVTKLIDSVGASNTLLILCGFLGITTLLKTSCYFGSSAVMVPISKGILRDMRMQLYRKILSLPLGFFSQERRGDIIARMTGDVSEVENSIMSSLDMLI